MNNKAIWFAGTCDTLLAKIEAWHKGYEQGKVHSTRDFLNESFQIVPKVTKRAHTIAFSQQEITYLNDIMAEYCDNKPLVREVGQVTDLWRSGPLTFKNMRKLILAFYPEHVAMIYNAVLKAKRQATMGKPIESLIEESKTTGKDLFEG